MPIKYEFIYEVGVGTQIRRVLAEDGEQDRPLEAFTQAKSFPQVDGIVTWLVFLADVPSNELALVFRFLLTADRLEFDGCSKRFVESVLGRGAMVRHYGERWSSSGVATPKILTPDSQKLDGPGKHFDYASLRFKNISVCKSLQSIVTKAESVSIQSADPILAATLVADCKYFFGRKLPSLLTPQVQLAAQLGPDWISVLASWPSLKHITIESTSITPDALKRLANLRISSLHISGRLVPGCETKGITRSKTQIRSLKLLGLTGDDRGVLRRIVGKSPDLIELWLPKRYDLGQLNLSRNEALKFVALYGATLIRHTTLNCVPQVKSVIIFHSTKVAFQTAKRVFPNAEISES